MKEGPGLMPLLAIGSALVAGCVSLPQRREPDETVLERLNARWLDAHRTQDAGTLRDILAPDFIAITIDGSTVDRDMLIANATRPGRRISAIRWRDVRIRFFGSAATVTGRSELVGCQDERDISGTNVYTDLYVKRAGRWWAVAAQVARVASQPGAATCAAGARH